VLSWRVNEVEEIMSKAVLRTHFGKVELRPVASPVGAPEGMQTYELMPDLDELLGIPGFGLHNPILIPASRPEPVPASLLFH
jgi:hypothetical protein